jgi:hypothetical protein
MIRILMHDIAFIWTHAGRRHDGCDYHLRSAAIGVYENDHYHEWLLGISEAGSMYQPLKVATSPPPLRETSAAGPSLSL